MTFDKLYEAQMTKYARGAGFGKSGKGKAGPIPNMKDKKTKPKGKHGSRAEGKKQAQDY